MHCSRGMKEMTGTAPVICRTVKAWTASAVCRAVETCTAAVLGRAVTVQNMHDSAKRWAAQAWRTLRRYSRCAHIASIVRSFTRHARLSASDRNSLFTTPTRTTQYCLVLSCPCRRCEHNWRQNKTVLSRLEPVSNLQLFSLKYIEDYWKLGNWKVGLDNTNCLVLSAVVLTSPTRTRQDSLVLYVSLVRTSCKKHETS